MIQKIDNCKYCNQKMESKTAKKRFCSEKCRVYFNREIKNVNTITKAPKISIITEKLVNNIKTTNVVVKSPINAKEMPKGLSIADQIQWKIDNL